VVLACLALAGAALVAAIVSGTPGAPPDARAFLSFPESSGTRWESLAEPGTLRLEGHDRFWLSFRAFSLGAPGGLTVAGDDGNFTFRLGSAASIHFAGPLYLSGSTDYRLTPGGAGTIFMSDYRLARHPLAAVPEEGFWPTEFRDADGTYFNWLNTAGTIELASRDRSARRMWLAFDLSSVDQPRSVTISGAGQDRRVDAPERGSSRRFVLGPFALGTDGTARLRVSSPGPQVYGSDPRRRTVRLGALAALPSPTAK
jgi:hypothetical protein